AGGVSKCRPGAADGGDGRYVTAAPGSINGKHAHVVAFVRHDGAAQFVCDIDVSQGVRCDTGRVIKQGVGAGDGGNRGFVEDTGAGPQRRIDRDAARIFPAVQNVDLTARIQCDPAWIE